MALKHEFTTDSGISLTEAYTKIQTVQADKSTIIVVISTFASQAARFDDKIAIEARHFTFTYSEADGYALVYAYTKMKELPEFSGAIDV